MALKHMSVKSARDLTSAKEVADCFHVPFEAMARSLQILAQRGLLQSEQGVQGGYRLIRPLSQVSLLEVIEAVEGPTQISKCLTKGEICEIQSHCNIISPVHDLNSRLTQFYQSLKVSDLLQAPSIQNEVGA